ncbi:MAG: cupredoxin domain-containing protein [Pseudomonadota bacterium]
MKKLSAFLILAYSLFAFEAFAEFKEYKIVIKDHKFSPQNLIIPANEKVKLLVENQDKTIEEFESHDLNREKIVGGGKTASIFVGPLKAGVYKYYGEFNEKTAQGTITAK